MNTCMLCTNPLEGAFRSGEHIILSAVGGRRKVFGFICKPCNSARGSAWDAELASQLLFFSNTANVKRGHGGKHPDHLATMKSGEAWKIRSDNVLVRQRPEVSYKDLGDRTAISVSAGDLKTFRTLMAKVAKDYPKLDVAKALEQAKVKETYLDQPLHVQLQFGGHQVGRSVVKSALALLSEIPAVGKAHCQRALRYLSGADDDVPYGHCYYVDIVQDRPTTHLFHCVSVVGQPAQRRILAYVEFYNCCRYLIHIGDGYDGDAFQKSYALDPVSGEELPLRIDFAELEDRLSETLESAGEPNEKRVEAVSGALDILMPINESRSRERAVVKAAEDALSQMGFTRESELSLEQREAWLALFQQNLRPYIESFVSRRFAPGPQGNGWQKDD